MSASLAEVDCERIELTSNLCLGQLSSCVIKEFAKLPLSYPVYVLQMVRMYYPWLVKIYTEQTSLLN